MTDSQSMSLRARINNYARKEGVSPQLALQGFFIERFLARVERSRYSGNLAVKGGTLMCAILGLPQRTTMDVDATLLGIRADEETIVRIVEAVAAVDAGDGIRFHRDDSVQTAITKDDEYGGIGIGLVAEFGTIRLPIGIDVTYGDVITPAPEWRSFASVVDANVRIRVLAYTVETLMAEKIQSILKRGVATTRPRDFYDLHMLRLRKGYAPETLRTAVANTVRNRKSEDYFEKRTEILDAIAGSEFQRRQWDRYRKKYPYARGIGFDELMESLADILRQV
jgi:predicted nucleotidyltransferase component of viral defense system